jgi:hypothetical protein
MLRVGWPRGFRRKKTVLFVSFDWIKSSAISPAKRGKDV